MMLLSFLLLPVALSMGRHMETEHNAFRIDHNTLKEVLITDKSPDHLNLSNFNLKAVDKNAFVNLSNLKTLNLANNSLKELPEFVFANLTNLENLNLANNNLDSGKCYVGLSSLKTLNISNNPLRIINPGDFFGLSKSVNISTQGLDLFLITAAMFENPSTLIRRPPVSPLDEDFRIIADVDNTMDESQLNLYSDFDVMACIENGHLQLVEPLYRNGTLRRNCQRVDTDGNSVQLSGMGIKTFEKGWFRLPQQNGVTLYLENNEITEFTKELLNDLPAGIDKISLAGNKIEKLKRGVIENKNYIDLLDLSGNRISQIDDGALEKLNLTNWLILDTNRLGDTKFLDTLPSNIRTVSLIRNNIKELSAGNFSKFNKFKVLDLSGNKLREIKAQRLRGFSSLIVLSLLNNNLMKIESGAFKDLKNLLTLIISENEISSLENGTFTGLDKINHIHLDSNKLKEIPTGVFSGMSKSLQVLLLSYNEIESLRAGTFVNVPTINLDLSRNKISMIEKGTFNIPDLKILMLDNNRLANVDGDAFEGLTNLNKLYLSSNNITTIKKGLAKNLSNLYNLYLSHNPIRILEKGSLFGLPKIMENTIDIDKIPVEIIQGGLFDDV